MTLNHLSLFSGIGGLDLAAHWAGFETIAFCEQNKFCQQVLGKHWPGVPIYDDIFTLTDTALAGRGIEPGTVTLISGGFPCQPYSHAGKRMGNADDRALWPQMLRVIREVRPLYVLGENVPGLISLALDGVLSDLESEGYTCQTIVLPACAVNAPHRRDRVFILAHSGHKQPSERGQSQERSTRAACCEFAPCGKTLADTKHNGQPTSQRTGSFCGSQQDQGWQKEPSSLIQPERSNTQPGLQQDVADSTSNELTRGGDTRRWRPELTDGSRWSTQSGMGMLADGVPSRVAKLKALGNAVVPAQAYPLLKAIAEYELQGQIA